MGNTIGYEDYLKLLSEGGGAFEMVSFDGTVKMGTYEITTYEPRKGISLLYSDEEALPIDPGANNSPQFFCGLDKNGRLVLVDNNYRNYRAKGLANDLSQLLQDLEFMLGTIFNISQNLAQVKTDCLASGNIYKSCQIGFPNYDERAWGALRTAINIIISSGKYDDVLLVER